MMEIDLKNKEIKISKELNKLDKFVLDFCKLLNNYVVVSGYVSILFGRSRATEDIDLLVPKMDYKAFAELWARLTKNGFECLNTSNPKEALKMLDDYAIRFCRKGQPVPNMEFKKAKKEEDFYSLNNHIKVKMGRDSLFISPIEMQIAYKLDLGKEGNEKDLEDAKHLYELFGEKLNKEELLLRIKKFEAEKEFEKIK